ncbi:MAG: hypothetical protein WD358_06400 [Nitriliruptoraceae bacterium]
MARHATMDAQPDVVQHVLSDIGAYADWAEGIQTVDILTAGAHDQPEQARFVFDSPLGPLSAVLAFTRGDDGIASELVEGDMLATFDAHYRVAESNDGGSVVHATLTVAVTTPMVPAVMVKSYADQMLERLMTSLAERCAHLEKGSPDGAK